jgi:transcription antitermination factor NusB
MRKRSQAREISIQVLYELDVRGSEVLGEMKDLIADMIKDPEIRTFSQELVKGTWENRPEIDRHIEEVARNWEISRMAIIDRNVLRQATYELIFREDIPPLVSINEAIEIAKKYSTQNSGAFINGILDNIRLRWAPEGKQKK